MRSGFYSPHVYFIFTNDILYIGETQRIPVKRWSSHLDKNGSFIKNLNKYLSGSSNEEYLKSLCFLSICCFDNLKDMQSQYCGFKVPAQALEYKLHEIVMTESYFGRDVKVISETEKTMPRNFYHWNEVEKIAQIYLAKISREIKKSQSDFPLVAKYNGEMK